MLLHLFIAALWSPEGKGLTVWLLFVMFIVTFVTITFGILVHVWYLIVSIPDPCCLAYFYKVSISGLRERVHKSFMKQYNVCDCRFHCGT